ncbi:hypothetical protein [Roseateles sp.]|uniref:hypothetical protein n=1 Tax=Roseateles sp. TaxID=1971397 RepID=UPI003BAD0967
MAHLYDHPTRSRQVDQPSGGGDDGDMDRITALETKWETVVPTLATKGDVQTGFAELRADMQEMNAGISRWMLGTVLTVIGTIVLGFGGLAWTVSNKTPAAVSPAVTAPAQQTAPIIINVPPYPPTVAPQAPQKKP